MIHPTYETKLLRAREPIARHDEIDAELSALLGSETKRGRPRKQREPEAPTEPTET